MGNCEACGETGDTCAFDEAELVNICESCQEEARDEAERIVADLAVSR